MRTGPDCGDPVVQDLYRTICRISYMGDIRMGIAEDADKVDRIVAGSYSSFEALYGRRMIQGRVAESAQLARSYTGSWRQTPSRAAHLQMTSELPMVRIWLRHLNESCAACLTSSHLSLLKISRFFVRLLPADDTLLSRGHGKDEDMAVVLGMHGSRRSTESGTSAEQHMHAFLYRTGCSMSACMNGGPVVSRACCTDHVRSGPLKCLKGSRAAQVPGDVCVFLRKRLSGQNAACRVC